MGGSIGLVSSRPARGDHPAHWRQARRLGRNQANPEAEIGVHRCFAVHSLGSLSYCSGRRQWVLGSILGWGTPIECVLFWGGPLFLEDLGSPSRS
jgi:hypothetical protein